MRLPRSSRRPLSHALLCAKRRRRHGAPQPAAAAGGDSGGDDAAQGEELARRLLPLLHRAGATSTAAEASGGGGGGGGASVPTALVRFLVAPSTRLAEKAAHALCLLAQRGPRGAARGVLPDVVADGAAATLLALLRRDDRPQVQQRALKAIGWLRAADEAEVGAALAARPELGAAVAARMAM